MSIREARISPRGARAVAAAAVLAAGAASAQTEDGLWPSAGPAGISLHPAGAAADGRRWALLRVALAPGWKTYWRSPGEAGVPPWFDWSAATNVGEVEIVWPAPSISEDFGMLTIGYAGAVAFPIAFRPKDPTAPSVLAGEVRIAACERICVPVSAEVAAEIGPETADPALRAERERGRAAAPRRGSAVEASLEACEAYRRDGRDRLSIMLATSAIDAPTFAIVEAAPGDLLGFGAPIAAEDGAWTFETALSAAASTAPIITIISTHDAVEISGCRPTTAKATAR